MAESDPNRLDFTIADLQFVIEEAGSGSLDPERLKQMVRDDSSFRNVLMSDEKVFNRVVFSEDEELLRISPVLYFDVLLRRALKILARRAILWSARAERLS